MWAVALLLFMVPLSVIGTWWLLPVWRFIEARTDLESVGHSGPASWCYGAVYLAFLAIAATAYFRWSKRRTSRSAV